MCVGLMKSKALRELLIGNNPWLPVDINNFLLMFKKSCRLKLLSLGEYQWITPEQAKVQKKSLKLF